MPARRHFGCKVEGCEASHLAHGLCGAHLGRLRRYGDPLSGGPSRIVRGDRSERFKSHVDQRGPDECWPWTASTTPNGYGQFFDGKLVAAHRVALELAQGSPVPRELDVDHTCHNADAGCPNGAVCLHRRCCNPAHLEAVTHLENVRRGHANQFARTGP